ncbi:MAG: NAD+ synthase, partial [Candidatus Nanohaloarchaea archaeon]
QDYIEKADAEGYVIGVSGGIDSAVTATLAVRAVGADKVHGYVMAGDPSSAENMEDARELSEDIGLKMREVNIEETVEKFVNSSPVDPGDTAEGNVRARVRMIYEYIEANQNNLLVLGPGNRTEIMTGYFTKYGDAAADIAPIADLYKTEVRDLAEHLGLDQKFIKKNPTAGLWEDQTDEGELGASYSTIDTILENMLQKGLNECEIEEKTGIENSEAKRFREIYERTEHKRFDLPHPQLR